MEEENITKKITMEETRRQLLKELEVLEKVNKTLDKIVTIMGEISDVCDEIKMAHPEIRKSAIAKCSEIQKKVRELYSIVSDTVY
ncbi:MAG: hypothetical protein OWT28_12320 [Firmicutes bacterium]|nr:hypothetical protein [Bacillota bacterium]